MKKSQKKFILKSIYTKSLIGLSLSLSGCMGVYEGGFECPPGEGVGCKSISEVNHMVDQGLGSQNQSSTSAQEAEDNEPVCKKRSGSCSASPEIWYAPSINLDKKEKCPTKDDNALSI
ncbi:hypothetical protein QM565_08340 [Geitlerinema splendidum]|nr:hypothetical protein [Geitlerinema splendidum]